MFYKMIENKCTQWYESERCTVKNLIEYIEKKGQMRDVQIEAIKVYLFLKIACECKPLTQLFRQGFFNSIDLNDIELSKSTREYLFQNPAAAALFEYACLTNDKGEQVYEKLEKQINHQSLSKLFGPVAVTNAEKVILERIQEKQGQIKEYLKNIMAEIALIIRRSE